MHGRQPCAVLRMLCANQQKSVYGRPRARSRERRLRSRLQGSLLSGLLLKPAQHPLRSLHSHPRSLTNRLC